MPIDLEALLERQRTASRDPSSAIAAIRKDRLRRAIDLLVTNEAALTAAMAAAFGVRAREQSQLYDLVASIQTLRHALKRADRWMKPERRPVHLALRPFAAWAWNYYQDPKRDA